ncbi:MAG: hypothetical protein NDJ89_15770 [Oligoflexia bacterium]|nr:hypothetical protein [Oligoflexia bacterium]
MFKSKKIVNFGLTLCAVLIAAPLLPAFGAGGDGGAFNGPSLAGTSIPVELERGITLDGAEWAVRVCSVLGDSSRGLIPLMSRIHEQALGRPPFKDDSKSGEAVIAGGTQTVWFTGDLRSSKSRVSIKLFSSNTSTEISYNDHNSSLEIELRSVPLPTISFERIEQDSGFDDWGREVNGQKILQGVHIRLPKEYGSAVPVYNQKTGKKTKLTLNHVEYAECLSNELQRNAIH